MVSEIRQLAEATEQNRNVFPRIIDKIRGAELLRTCRPREFGGFEAVALHVSLNWDAVGTMYGQHAFGLEPRGQY